MSRILTKILLVVCLLNISFFAYAKSPPPGTGEADVKANILIMLDVSGSMNDPPPAVAAPGQFKGPNDADVDSGGNLHTINYGGNYVTVHDNTGASITTYGVVNSSPAKIAVDTSNDSVYTKQSGKVNRYVKGGTNSWTHSWTVTMPSGSNNDGSDLAVDPITHRIYVSDQSHNKYHVLNASDGSIHRTFTRNPSNHYKIAIDGANRAMHMTNSGNIETIDLNNLHANCDAQPSPECGFNSGGGVGSIAATPSHDIEVDRDGNIYFATGSKVYKYKQNVFQGLGSTNTLLGSKSCPGHGSVYGLGVDKTVAGNGTVYVPNYGGNKVIKYNMAGDDPTAWTCGTTVTSPGVGNTPSVRKITMAKNVIKALMAKSSLTDGARFGLMEWDSSADIKVGITATGHQEINTMVDDICMSNGHSHPHGSPSCGGGTMPKRAIQKAYELFNGQLTNANPPFPDPRNSAASCENNFLILISDGSFSDNPNSEALRIYNDLGVKTFVVGFAFAGGSSYQQLATNGQTGAPLYANDEANLLATLSDAITQVLQQSLTFSAPKIMPDVNLGDHIFQAVFDYKTSKQWQGKLKKYALAADGSITVPHIWDAGERLNLKNSDNRKIWSVGSNFASPTSLNNFVNSDIGTIKYDLYRGDVVPTLHPIGSPPNQLLEFVRGKDSYDYDSNAATTQLAWKLADIYHSEPTIIGKPPGKVLSSRIYTDAYYRFQNGYSTFKSSKANRKRIIVAGSNAGMLHAFDDSDGDELWAFIPPSMVPKLRSIVKPSNPNATTSIFGVDGSPVVKDIFYGGSWRTVLLGGLGRGGHSYYALDVTDTENPRHLFTFENDHVHDEVTHWDASGTKNTYGYGVGKIIPPEYDYRLLGETFSTPKILRIRIGSTDKWVAVFGAGFNNNVTSDFGSAVYVIDLEDGGKVLKVITLSDTNDPNTSPVTNLVRNSVPASLIPVTADSTTLAQYYGALVYFADYEGKLWKINLTNNGTLYDAQILFDAEATGPNERRVMHEVGASIDASTNDLWLYYGTGDQQNLANESTNINNKLYGIKDTNFPNYATTIVTATENSCLNTTSLSVNCTVGTQQAGWYYNLGLNEKVTSKPSIFNRQVYFSKYLPNSANPCAPGKAQQDSFAYASGCKSRATVDLGTGVATAATFYKGKMYLGLSGASSSDTTLDGNADFNVFDNIIVGTPVGGSNSSNHPRIKSWRQLK